MFEQVSSYKSFPQNRVEVTYTHEKMLNNHKLTFYNSENFSFNIYFNYSWKKNVWKYFHSRDVFRSCYLRSFYFTTSLDTYNVHHHYCANTFLLLSCHKKVSAENHHESLNVNIFISLWLHVQQRSRKVLGQNVTRLAVLDSQCH